MRRRVLVVEAADAIRGVAETVLRQNGYEVISVAGPDRAGEVLQFSRPDLLIVSGDMRAKNDQPLHSELKDSPRAADIPMLLIAPSDGSELENVESEQIIPQPFDPKEFLAKVTTSLGDTPSEPDTADVPAAENSDDTDPGGEHVDEEFLDAALGIDQDVKVTDSEEFNKSRTKVDKNDSGDVAKVESMTLKEEPEKKPAAEPKKEPEGLEFSEDEFGMHNPQDLGGGNVDDGEHDYHWFLDSLQKETREENLADDGEDDDAESSPSQQPSADDAEDLEFTATAAYIDPVTPGPPTDKKQQETVTSQPVDTDDSQVSDADSKPGVDQFIDEFKKEMAALRSDEPEEVAVSDSTSTDQEQPMNWEDKLESLTPDQLSVFTRQFTRDLADRVAEKIVDKIDSDKLMHLIKSEILSRIGKSS